MDPDEIKIKPRLKAMAEYYCGECAGNAEKSAIKAGYSERYARGNAYKLVANSGFQRYVKYLTDITHQQRIATIAEIKEFWTEIMNDEREETKDRLRASEFLAKSQGAFFNDW